MSRVCVFAALLVSVSLVASAQVVNLQGATGTDPLLREVFKEHTGARAHETFGVGFVAGSLEIAAGGDFADAQRTAIVSTTVRFK